MDKKELYEQIRVIDRMERSIVKMLYNNADKSDISQMVNCLADSCTDALFRVLEEIDNGPQVKFFEE